VIFFIAVMGTQVVAMLMSVFGVEGLTHAIGWGFGTAILGISLFYFVILDVVKVYVMRYWSFELTARLWPSPARRKKLADRRAQDARTKRVAINLEKVRKVVRMSSVLVAFANAKKQNRGHQEPAASTSQ
jgi:H+-transporting ATPase